MLKVLVPSLLVALPAVVLPLRPVEGAPMLVYAPRAQGLAAGVLARADARLVRAYAREDLMVVMDATPGLVRRLYAAGATLVLFAPLRAGCPI
ncbi:MAG: hypothetical protein LCH39_00390 [Proteobacteria bacterium]|nr:hypothetical protein [Pseudomonadota bacterium]